MPCPGCLREGFLCEWQDRDHYFRERHRISASGSGRSKRDRHASSSPAAAAGSSHGERLHARRHRPVAGGLEAIAETQNPQGNGLIAPLPTWDYDYSRRCFNYSSDSESSLGSAIPSPSPSHSADYISAVEDIQASSFMPNSDALSGEDIFGLPPSLSPGSIMSPMGTAATASFDATPALAGLDESFDFLTPLDGAVRLPDASTTPLEGLWTDFDWSTLSSAPIPSQAGALPLNDSYYYAADAAWYMPRHGFPGCA
ncbi:hypothetical protein PUNSTDRAFT_50212 [Punctularia strigosozonata HHB-11173 SS5]|uniref:uncharacterized protein n=1 Tax=Punctularia strigosozonata (strain HHB-11173) TaxID=741275 RepID=UPI0004416D8B|nr:uncharacterized protein PUNSTDRAFT_50212 [Punctularia strigosozonata HHB-11173 SS5]EIN13045.1 hypothetical protein PUNSTDRAFT_50212 [Punctularia strigosozonata HHB-11173 SS5]